MYTKHNHGYIVSQWTHTWQPTNPHVQHPSPITDTEKNSAGTSTAIDNVLAELTQLIIDQESGIASVSI